MNNQIVAHFKNDHLLKGYTQDFTPQTEIFTLKSESDIDVSIKIRTTDLKALFFVKIFEGTKDYLEKKTFNEFDVFGLRGLKIKAVFYDGEIMRGMSFDYCIYDKGFSLIPVDPLSNNEMVYVLADSLIEIATGTEAEA